MGKMESLTPCKIETLEQIDTKFVSKGVKCHFLVIYLVFFWGMRRDQTLWPILRHDGSKCAESRKDVPFWGLKYLILTFDPYFPPKMSNFAPRIAISSQNDETWKSKYIRNHWTNVLENLTQCYEREILFLDAMWWRHKESNMADGRHIENHILAISPRLTRNFVWRSRITLRHRSRDQNTRFWKFKMADGLHFENGFIAISQPEIIRFQWNLVCLCRFWF